MSFQPKQKRHADKRPSPGPLERTDFELGAVLLFGALVLYGFTVCRTVYWGDSAEFSVVCPLLDITHPTGYPLYTMLGKLFSLVPIGEVAFRINAFGAVASALACGLLYLDARRLGIPRASAAFGGALFAVSLELWDNATAAEVYSFQTALTAAVLLAALSFRLAPSRRRLAATAGLLGLSFTNHMTTLWTVPCVVWLVLADWRPWRPRTVWVPARRDLALAAGAFALALSLYAYVPIRSCQGVLFNHGEPGTAGRFLYHLTGKQFQYRMFVQPDRGLWKEISDFLELLKSQFTPWLLLLAAAGGLSLALRDAVAAVALALLSAANLVFDLNYHIPDKTGYFLPVYLAVALLMAEGFAAVSKLVRGRLAVPPSLGVAVACLLVCLNLHAHFDEVDKSANRSLPEFTEELLKRLPPGGLLLADDQFLVWSTAYEQLIDGKYGDRMLVNDYLLCLPWYVHHLRRRWPELVIPKEVDELVEERGRDVAKAAGWEIGDISQRYTEKIARRIVLANLPMRRVFWNFHDSEERKAWQGLPFVNRGLFYEVFAAEPAPAPSPWPCDYPDPGRYAKSAISDPHWKHVADTFSVACNRDGIVLIGVGRYKEARRAFERALEYNPEYPQVHLNLGVLFNQYLPQLGKRDEHWRKFVEMAPKDPQADAVRKALGK